MNAMKILIGAVLALSLALNVILWRHSLGNEQLQSAAASAAETEDLRRQVQELQSRPPVAQESPAAEARELARLRNEVVQLRKDAAEAAMLRPLAAEAAQLRGQLAAATQNLARAETAMAESLKLSPEEIQRMKDEGQSSQCVNNLKQIGLAARIWANDHNDTFPPDFLTMKDELNTPKILFCPSDPFSIRVSDWAQFNPATISYRLLNPNGKEGQPKKALSMCPTHGHILYSDGSVGTKR